MPELEILKLDITRRETWRYPARLLVREPNAVIIEAFFNRDDLPFNGITLGRGDRFVEKFFADRWYNIFEIHDRQDDRLKAWYCNVCLPSEIQERHVAYVDLALDLLVFSDGRQIVLDEDEFDLLPLDEHTRKKALEALVELQYIMRSPQPFECGSE